MWYKLGSDQLIQTLYTYKFGSQEWFKKRDILPHDDESIV